MVPLLYPAKPPIWLVSCPVAWTQASLLLALIRPSLDPTSPPSIVADAPSASTPKLKEPLRPPSWLRALATVPELSPTRPPTCEVPLT